jgi:hypothetical protein
MSISDLSLAQYTVVGNNIAIPLPPPYQSSWTWVPGSWWSKNLVKGGKFDEVDGVLLAFMVDYAMKLYISADMHEQSATTLNTLITSELAWAIVLAGRSCAAKRIRKMMRFLLQKRHEGQNFTTSWR